MTFLWGWMFLLLPLPWLIQRLQAKRAQQKEQENPLQGALQVPFFAQLQQQVTVNNTNAKKSAWFKRLIFALAWVLLVTALARPALVGKEIPLPTEGRDVMLAIDLSGSMQQQDLGTSLNRLDVVKSAVDEFIARRKGDRLGLILFSDRAYLQAPLTFDRQVVQSLLTEAQVGLTGQKTAIGDAIAVALKRLQNRPHHNADGSNTTDTNTADKNSQVLVLLTDGANNAGIMQPLQSAQLAKKMGIKIYTIGVGGTGQVVDTFFGQQTIATSDLDEKTLSEIAQLTGGKYFRATDAQGLKEIYKDIDALEPIAGTPTFVRPSVALYYYPATLALLLLMVLMLGQTLPHYLRQRVYNRETDTRKDSTRNDSTRHNTTSIKSTNSNIKNHNNTL